MRHFNSVEIEHLRNMERWSGKVALVTGAGSGIGAATAEKLAKAGVKVFGVDILVEKVEALKKKIGNVKGEIIPLKGDVSKENEILEAFKIIREKFGTIHILVNSAGIARMGLLSDGNVQHFRNVFDVNVLGLTICAQQALKLMKESNVNDGHIIHINSTAGHIVLNIGEPIFNVYSASKFAVTALTESLRQELVYLKSKIKVSSISPGFVESELRDAAAVNSGKEIEDFSYLPKLEAKDIADAVVYVLSTPPHVQVHELSIKPLGARF